MAHAAAQHNALAAVLSHGAMCRCEQQADMLAELAMYFDFNADEELLKPGSYFMAISHECVIFFACEILITSRQFVCTECLSDLQQARRVTRAGGIFLSICASPTMRHLLHLAPPA